MALHNVSLLLLNVGLGLIKANDVDLGRATPSPISEFSNLPRNSTVPLGAPTILPCKLINPVYKCRWLHLKPGFEFFHPDHSSKISIVKADINPRNGRDCSIQLNKVTMVQKGQWVCQGLSQLTNKYIVSPPAFLNVLSPKEQEEIEVRNLKPTTDAEAEKIDPATEKPTIPNFHTNLIGIVNANIGDRTLLRCRTRQKPLTKCQWIDPNKVTGRDYGETDVYDYNLVGNLSRGECFLEVKKVRGLDEGNWQCKVNLNGSKKGHLGPVIHLHVEDSPNSHMHPEDLEDDSVFSKKSSSLIVILVAVALVLLLLVVSLVAILIQRKAWRRRPVHKYIETNRDGQSEYSGYGPWIPEFRANKDPGLLSDHSSMQYNAYLNMSGRASGRNQFTDSLNSAISVRTLGPAPSIPIAALEARRNKSELNVNSSTATFGNPTFEGHQQTSSEEERPSSVYSNNHLYEDLDQFARSRLHADEDTGGYMVPNRRERLPTPPPNSNANSYSNINEIQQQRDSGFDPTEDQSSPPVPPPRLDSAEDNPLASYDIPKKSLESLADV